MRAKNLVKVTRLIMQIVNILLNIDNIRQERPYECTYVKESVVFEALKK